MIVCFGDYIDDYEHWLFVRRYVDGIPVCRAEDVETKRHPGGAGIGPCAGPGACAVAASRVST